MAHDSLMMLCGGYNRILAYGQTGSGKTHTMLGARREKERKRVVASASSAAIATPIAPNNDNDDIDDELPLISDDEGLIPRVLKFLFSSEPPEATALSYTCSIALIPLLHSFIHSYRDHRS